MHINRDESQRVFRSKVDASGRVLLPAELRSGMYVAEGDSILFVQHRQSVEIRTLQQAATTAQDFFCRLAPADVRLTDQFVNVHQARADQHG